jgi:Spy/CpxP family protein refolding chaperone
MQDGLLVIAAICAVAGAPAVAVAQDGGNRRGGQPQQRDWGGGQGAQWGGMGQNQIGEQDVQLMVRVLTLDEPQQVLANELYADLREARTRLGAELREKMQELRGEGRPDGAAMEQLRELGQQMQERTRQLEAAFYDDIKLVLTAEQRASWSSFERQRDRAQALRGVAGASDVAAIFESFASRHASELEANELAGGRALSDRFASEIDRQVAERDRVMNQNRPQRGGEGFDREAMREMMEARRAADEKIIELSTRYSDQIERTLPVELREAFRFEINRDSLGTLMRRGNIVERMEAAMDDATLSATQKQSLREIEADMHKRFNALAKEISDTRTQAREQRGGDNARPAQRGGQRGEGMREIREKMQEIENEISRKMRSVTGDGDA